MGDVRAPPRLALPLTELVARAEAAKSALERHHGVFYLAEALIRLLGAAAVNAWLASDPAPGDPGWARVEALARPSLGHWLAWIREVGQALDPPALRFEPGPTAAAEAWIERLRERGVFDGSEARAVRRHGPIAFLELVGRYRNDVLGHGAQRLGDFYEAVSEPLLAAVLEAVDRLPWVRDGALLAPPAAPGSSWRRLSGGSATADVRAPAARGVVALAGTGELSLDPWVLAGRDEGLDRDRILFFNRAVVRGRSVRRVEHLDYATGEVVDEPGAAERVGDVLGRARALEDDATGSVDRVGDYVLGEVLGRGAMGVVRVATQLGLQREVALKTLAPALADDTIARERFAREVRALGRCHHPNVVQVLAAGVADGLPYYAMERVAGRDLAQVAAALGPGRHTVADLERAVGAPPSAGAGAPLGPALAGLFAGVADGLAHLHARGIVHRDVKPANLMLTADARRLVLMDLGLAHLADASRGLTLADDRALGTLRYMPAEQLEQNAAGVDGRADVYALGATCFELVAGRPFLDGDTRERLIHQILRTDAAALDAPWPEAPPGLAAVLRRATRARREDRYPSAEALAADLRAVAEGRTPEAARAARRPPHRAVAAGILLGIGGLGAVALALGQGEPPPQGWALTLEPAPAVGGVFAERISAGGVRLAADGRTAVFARDGDVFRGDREDLGAAVNLTAAFEPRAGGPLPDADGRRILFGSDGATWVLEGDAPPRLVDPDAPPLGWLPGGELLVMALSDLDRHGFATHGAIRRRRLDGGPGSVVANDLWQVRVSPAGDRLVGRSGQQIPRSGDPLAVVRLADGRVFPGPAGLSAVFGFSPDGRSVFAVRAAADPLDGPTGDVVALPLGPADGDVVFGEPVPLAPLPGWLHERLPVALAPGGDTALGATFTTTTTYALLTLDAEHRLVGRRPAAEGADEARLLGSGEELVVVTEAGGELRGTVTRLAGDGPGATWVAPAFVQHGDGGTAAGGDATWIVTEDEVFRLDWRTGERRRVMARPADAHGIAVSPDGLRAAVTDAQLRVVVVPTDAPDLDAALVAGRAGGIPHAEAAAFTPDGRGLLVVDEADDKLVLHDLATGASRKLAGRGARLEWLDADTIVVGTVNRVYTLDLAEGAEPRVLLEEADRADVVGVSADGTRVLVELKAFARSDWLFRWRPVE